MWIIKQCSACNEFKELRDFGRNNSCKFGRLAQCRYCRKRYYERDKNSYLNRASKWQKTDRAKEYKREHYQKNKQEYIDRNNLNYRKRKENNEQFRIIESIRGRVSGSIRRGGYTKQSRAFKILGCDYETFKKHIESQFTSGMNWSNHGVNGWHYDHIIPMASAITEEDAIRLNHYTNFQPLWAEDNRRKSGKF